MLWRVRDRPICNRLWLRHIFAQVGNYSIEISQNNSRIYIYCNRNSKALLGICVVTIAANYEQFTIIAPSTALSNATRVILWNYFAQQTSTMYIFEGFEQEQNKWRQLDIINKLLMMLDSSISYRFHTRATLTATTLRFHNLFFVDSYAGFRYVTSYISNHICSTGAQ